MTESKHFHPGVIVQARTGSTRLPGKILKELPCGSGVTALEQVIFRLQQSHQIEAIVIATTTHPEDEVIVEIAEKQGVLWYRGSSEDVLSRYFEAAVKYNIDPVLRVTSDCPCIDPGIIDRCVEEFYGQKVDYLSNTLERTFPHGLDVEVFSFDALKTAHEEAKEQPEREHVTPFIIQHKKQFSRYNVKALPEETAPEIRITLDTLEDYTLLCCVFDALYETNPFFGVREIVTLFHDKPYLHNITRKIVQKKIFNSLDEEYKEALKILKLQDLNRMVAWLKKQKV